MLQIAAVVAASENGAIGNENKMLWHLPADLKYFKQLTVHKAVLMGRKTFESIGRPLPNRLNLVLSRQQGFSAKGCTVVSSLDEATAITQQNQIDTLFVIGGGEVYKQMLPFAQTLYLTKVKTHISVADAHFTYSPHEWQEISLHSYTPDEQNPLPMDFVVLKRKT